MLCTGPALALPVFGTIRDLPTSMFVLCIIMGLSSLNQSGILANHLDIAPTVAGQVQGITNSVATIPGMMAVAITGQILHHFNSWMAVFLVCSAIQVRLVRARASLASAYIAAFYLWRGVCRNRIKTTVVC